MISNDNEEGREGEIKRSERSREREKEIREKHRRKRQYLSGT